MVNDDYQRRNLKPDFSTALAKMPPSQRLSRYRSGTGEDGGFNWLITFTDIMGLMLTFFVMMYAMSVPEKEKFEDIATSLSTELSKNQGDLRRAGPEDNLDMRRIDFGRALELDYLKAVIRTAIEQDDVLKNTAVISRRGDRLALSIPDLQDFPPGQAQLKDAAKQRIFTLGGSFSRIKNQLELSGYADHAGDSSPWALSLMRAAAVAATLEKVGYTAPVILRGTAIKEQQPEKQNKEKQNQENQENQAGELSRRVDIVIMNHDGKVMRVFRD